MPYQPINLPSDVPPNVRLTVEQGIDPMLREVHAMFSVVIDGPNHLQLSIANMLLAVISGLSATLYATEADYRVQFTGLLIDHFPWADDPPEGVTAEDAASILWEECRNPMAHRVGLRPRKAGINEIKLIKGRTAGEIDKLLMSETHPGHRPSVIVNKGEPLRTVIWVDSLYWSVRRMAQNMVMNRKLVAAAEQWMTELKFLPPRLR